MNEEQVQAQGPALPSAGTMEETSCQQQAVKADALPEWKVSGIFSSHMVVQRQQPVKVWGWSRHVGAQISAFWEKASCAECQTEDSSAKKEVVTGIVDENGRFEVTFSPRLASFVPTRMTISSAYGSDTFEDILVGDVWLVGGQSNAELNLAPCLADSPEIAATLEEDHPIRLFCQTQGGAISCTEYLYTASRDIIKPEWCWKRPDEKAAKEFSAIGYYVARMIQPQINIPVGMVMMCAGGACLRELMPVELAHKLGYTQGANVPVAGYYHTLIAPLIGIGVKGQIFFQGESEGIWEEMAHSYGEDLAAFVEDERQRFGVHFGFYNVQLASYREECDDYFPHLYWVRASQFKALSLIPDYYLTVDRDLGSLEGEPDFAHSPHKYALAKRLAAQILAAEYGIGELEKTNSPMPVKAVRKDNRVTVTFDHVNGGLCRAVFENEGRAYGNTVAGYEKQGAVKGFSFMDADGREIPAPAAILTEDTVSVEIPNGADVSQVHYAMNNMAYLEQADLCGGTGLAVPAFAVPVADGK